VHETYRMLGQEHELDLEREARNRKLAAGLPGEPGRVKPALEPKIRRSFFQLRPLIERLAR
jgi:hypothetical protein